MKIVLCEKCFNIPKITILNNNKIKIECQKCETQEIKDIPYFDKFIHEEDQNLFKLPICNYYKNHEKKSIIYCFQCNKYLCESCLELHKGIITGNNHFFIKQKIQNVFYCKKQGHENYILDQYCEKCNVYLCSRCKCEHNEHDLYNFDNTEKIINQIKENIDKCEKIIAQEENLLKTYISKIQKQIDNLNNKFNEYKKRNLNAISIYKLLINNYEQIKKIKNYNLYNNIYINNNFNLESVEVYNDECFNSNYNRLTFYYMNTNHIKTKEYTKFFITPKICNKRIKKCIVIDKNLFAFITSPILRSIFFCYQNENSLYNLERKPIIYFVKDIYSINENKFIIWMIKIMFI